MNRAKRSAPWLEARYPPPVRPRMWSAIRSWPLSADCPTTQSRSGTPSRVRASHSPFPLADRGSRLALYDVRETLETVPGPLPVEFLSALTAVGDVSCLEPIAA